MKNSCVNWHSRRPSGPFIVGAAFALLALPSLLAAEEATARRSGFAELPAEGTVKFEPTADEPRVPEHFRLEKHDFSFHARPLRTLGPVRMLKLAYPSPVQTPVDEREPVGENNPANENSTVHAEYFQPAGEGPFPACVVLHILGGDFALAEALAQHLARNKIAALFVKMPYYGERRVPSSGRRMISVDPDETAQGMTQAVLDIRRATAWLATRPEVDPQRLGITGISLGGITSALAAAAEPRLQSVAVVLGGGNFSNMLWSHQAREAVEFRKKWLERGGTKESFHETISRVDPATYGHLLKGRRVLMVAASNDEVVPPESALALWESIGKEPQLVWLDAGHYTAAKFLPREMVRLDMFFNGP
jgi:poly(3-hydroxybutyrate) depolymerase